MSLNVGGLDRGLRLLLGWCGWRRWSSSAPRTPWGWIGLVPLITGLVRFCPLYRLLGICSAKA